MLSEAPVDVVLLSQDLAGKSKRFYTEKLGLSIIDEDESAISYRCGETRLKVTASTTGTKDEQTQASWRVIDVHAEVRELQSRGVKVEEYDTDEITTVDGVADQGSAWVAWVTDPDGNVLGIEQPKEQ